jgi:hypothetical protein
VSVFTLPEPLVLRALPDGRRTVAAVGTMKTDSGEVAFVRVGVQFCTANGEWRWSKGEGCTIPLRKLGALAAWLVDAARAIPRPEPRDESAKGWSR